ncbi:amino acid permease [Desulfosporosinus sp. PR]|uniref:amino acid permease n=1 Tax=Candidatus Desulfosporosinus nitrosoreducens TaxID=3401928 RepID=UPI0027ED8A72|nr:amino acid permease [Desulfosporosinus sp. PR]MDQ7092248.1 amino acid permease [Desulfosporosinus sp. PR]
MANAQKMSAISLTMLALGSIIGAGMFLGSGSTIKSTGPSVIAAYVLLGLLMYFNLSFLAELSLLDPEQGSFQTYAGKAFGSGAGFVIGWLYWVSGILVMSSEVTAAAIFSSVWFPGIPLWLFVLVYSLALTLINLIDARGFGKVESLLAIIKVIALLGFILLSLVLIFTPWLGHPFGWKNLADTSFLPGGLSGFAGSLLLVFYAYSGTSVVGLAIADSENPERTVPKVVIATVGLTTILYVISIVCLLLLQPWSAYNVSASPYVTSLLAYKIGFAQHIMNFVILTAALSAMSASMYGTSRMLTALSRQGEAPRFFSVSNSKGVPFRALLFTNVFLLGIAFLSYLIPNRIYLLVTGASGLLSLINVLTISLSHWRLRPALMKNNPRFRSRVPWYPVSNMIVAVFFAGIFIFALAIPDQRPSFILGLGLILLTAAAYLVLHKKLPLRAEAEPGGHGETLNRIIAGLFRPKI